MTPEEALKEFYEVLMPEVAVKFNNPKCGLFPRIREALEKQIAKKPINQQLTIYGGGTKVIRGKCPECGQPVDAFASIKTRSDIKARRDEDYFCPYCGQALDWGGAE